jgi:hypothetical protein
MCYGKKGENTCCIPVKCLMANGARAHRICSHCWWEPISGFAREGASHKCPGCENNFQLTAAISSRTVIDLTDD